MTENLLPQEEPLHRLNTNTTLYIQQFTCEPCIRPEIVEHISSLQELFEHFKPSCTCELESPNGMIAAETFTFTQLDDFLPKNIVSQSSVLLENEINMKTYEEAIITLTNNKVMSQLVSSPENRQALIHVLTGLLGELDAE